MRHSPGPEQRSFPKSGQLPQIVVDPALPSFSAGPVVVDHIGIEPDGDDLLRLFERWATSAFADLVDMVEKRLRQDFRRRAGRCKLFVRQFGAVDGIPILFRVTIAGLKFLPDGIFGGHGSTFLSLLLARRKLMIETASLPSNA
jgi:hypothetical protein